MKCPKCNGKGYVYNALGSFNEDCGHCQGTGKVRVEGEPMTNEEWLRSATTEQLAEWIAHQTMIALLENQNNHSLRMTYPAYWVEWLKQPHNREE